MRPEDGCPFSILALVLVPQTLILVRQWPRQIQPWGEGQGEPPTPELSHLHLLCPHTSREVQGAVVCIPVSQMSWLSAANV